MAAWSAAVMQRRCMVAPLGCLLWHSFCAVLAGGAARPCVESDWRFTFGACRSDAAHDSETFRNIYTYPAGADDIAGAEPVCDAEAAVSYPHPRPHPLKLSCSRECPAGFHLGVHFEALSAEYTDAKMRAACQLCPAGKFSLGGGLMVSGVAGDWLRRWPVELQTTCMYKTAGQWFYGGHKRHDTKLRVEAPLVIHGDYRIAPASWNDAGASDGPLVGVLMMAPGDGLACSNSMPQLQPLPRVVLLVQPGGCLPKDKARNAARAGAFAVLLMNQGYQAVPFVSRDTPIKQDEEKPPIPLFAIGREDAEVFEAASKQSGITVNISSLVPEAAPPPESNYTTLGCNVWDVDPSGRFVHSGNNQNHQNIISFLSMNVHLVRDGHVVFRYSVDAEVDFDGLVFEVDWNEKMKLTSKQEEYKDFKVNLTAGTHLLEWMYTKDYATSAGRDSAQLQLIEVVGTAHADLQCRGCHSARTHSGAGAAHCNGCKAGEFLQAGDDAQLTLGKCATCPVDTWSSPGAVGFSSCHERLPCASVDIVDSYTTCKDNKRYEQQLWREPIICNKDLVGSVTITGAQVELPCNPCQPNEHRPDGGRCVPQFPVCGPDLHAVLELIVNRWQDWPRNFTHEVFILREDLADQDPSADQSDRDHPDGHGWRLSPSGDLVSTGYLATGGATSPSSSNTSSPGDDDSYFGDALLHLDVDLVMQGSVSFFAEVFPPEAWEQEATFLVDQLPARMNVVRSSGAILEVSASLNKGRHRLCWGWKYHSSATGDSSELQQHYYRLLNVTVVHAAGAGSSRCEECPPGNEIGQDKHSCNACTPGQFLMDAWTLPYKHCVDCPKNNFSSTAGSTACRNCGQGTASEPGAAYCHAVQELAATPTSGDLTSLVANAINLFNPTDKDPLVFNVDGIAAAWHEATAGVTGPFAVGGRQYVLGLFSPTTVPGVADSGSAFAWELLQDHDDSLSGPSNDACAGRNANDYESLGWNLASVRGGFFVTNRGVSMGYEDGELCRSTGISRHVNMVFLCQVTATFSGTPAHKDSLGLYHLERLRMGGYASHEGADARCDNVTLEWLTSAACPRCRRTDYTPHLGECGSDGQRQVTFPSVAEECVGGAEKPKPYKEKCKDSSQDQDKLKSIVVVTVGAVVITFAGICCYACHLHRKYAHMVPDL